jgi:hypothetical protein
MFLRFHSLLTAFICITLNSTLCALLNAGAELNVADMQADNLIKDNKCTLCARLCTGETHWCHWRFFKHWMIDITGLAAGTPGSVDGGAHCDEVSEL